MSTVLFEKQGKTAILTLNRPDKLNALNEQVFLDLQAALNTVEADRSLRAVILTGSGEKAFAAGADIAEFLTLNHTQLVEKLRFVHNLYFRIEQFSIPTIAAINGFALGGGLELAMACHFRIASSNAKMGLPEAKLGLLPGYGGTQRLPRLVGRGRALQMLFTAEALTADKAEAWGLVNEVCEPQALMTRCTEIANAIAANSGKAQRANIVAVQKADNRTGYEEEIAQFSGLFQSDEFTEGVNAFMEKRTPQFS